MRYMKSSLVMVGLWLLASTTLPVGPLSAQGHTAAFTENETLDATFTRETCAQRASVVLDRSAAPEDVRLNILHLGYCELTGPEVLVEAWGDPALRSIDPFALGRASGMIQDQRIFDAVLRVVLDEGAPFDDRIAGVGVLAGYLIPGLYVASRDRWGADGGEWPRVDGPWMHATWTQGREPLAPGTSDRILELLRTFRGDWDTDDLGWYIIGSHPGEGLRPTDETRFAVAAHNVLLLWEIHQRP